MCLSAPKIPAAPAPAQFQAAVQPKNLIQANGDAARRKRGMYSTIFTSPEGVGGAPRVTGTSGGITGG